MRQLGIYFRSRLRYFSSCGFTGCRFPGDNLYGSTLTGCKFDYAFFERTLVNGEILEVGWRKVFYFRFNDASIIPFRPFRLISSNLFM
jgi:uncharacterized protein YjbI with pentapeptide repeats